MERERSILLSVSGIPRIRVWSGIKKIISKCWRINLRVMRKAPMWETAKSSPNSPNSPKLDDNNSRKLCCQEAANNNSQWDPYYPTKSILDTISVTADTDCPREMMTRFWVRWMFWGWKIMIIWPCWRLIRSRMSIGWRGIVPGCRRRESWSRN